MGKTDPISNMRDGSMLHICRIYKPDEVYLYMSKEILQDHWTDNRYLYCLDKLSEKIKHSFEVRTIERPDLINVHKLDDFYDEFSRCLQQIPVKTGEKILLNVSSGTPAMKMTLQVLAGLHPDKYIAIQVESPAKASNKEHEDTEHYDVELQWEYNLDNNDKEFETLCLDWADWLMNCIPRTKEGGFQHVTSANGDRQGVRLNENEMWIDTLFMTVLFLNKIGQKYNRQDWIDESIHQVLMHIKYLYDTHTGLFYHGWSFNRMDNFGGIFWCRGNSWFTLGILDYVEAFRGTLNSGVKTLILDTYKAQVKKLKELQGSGGLWHTVLTDPSSYEEVSGSAAIAAGIMKGIRMGILDDSYLECAQKAVRGILNNIDKDGTVLNVSGGTGMGYDAEHYKNIMIAPMAYGQSLTILALIAALELY